MRICKNPLAIFSLTVAIVCASAFAPHTQAQNFFAGAATPASNKPITIAVSGKVFADIHDGKPIGVIAEAVELVAKQMGLQTRYIVMSEKEMMPKLRSGEVAIGGALLLGNNSKDLIFSPLLIREYNVLLTKRGKGKPVEPPPTILNIQGTLSSIPSILNIQDTFSTKQGQVKSVDSLADLKGLRLGGRTGFSYPLLEKTEDIDLQRNDKDGDNLRGLFLDKLDMAVVASVSDIYEFNSEGVMSDLVVLDKAVGHVDLGLVFSVAALGETTIGQFNQALSNLLVSPEWKQLLGQNGLVNLERDWPMIDTQTEE